ncbi:MAG: ribosome-associated translation inhibitor RaiA [Blastocatellia bacterium]
MKFEYTGRHIEVTPALKSHVEAHFKRIQHLFDGKPAKAHIIIEVFRGRHRSEIIVTTKKGLFTATTTNSDMYKSLSETISKIEKQVLKTKNKIIDSHHKAKRKTAIGSGNGAVEPEPKKPRIITARRYAIKPMTAEEAALFLDDQATEFLVFRKAENQKVAVIYRRKDGNYGLIEP